MKVSKMDPKIRISISFRLILFSLLAVGYSNKSYTQTEELASFELGSKNGKVVLFESQVIEDKLLVILRIPGNEKEFKSIDLLTKEVKDLGELEDGATNIVLTDSGAYYITQELQNNSIGNYRIRRIDLEGNRFTSNRFGDIPLADNPILFEAIYYKNEFYVFLKHLTESGIWKSSAQQQQVELFYEPNNLVGHFIFEDSLVFIEHHNHSLYVSITSGSNLTHNYSSSGLIGTFSHLIFNGVHHQKAYFGAATSSNQHTFQFDFTGLQQFLPNVMVRDIAFKGNNFHYLHEFDYGNGSNLLSFEIYKAPISDPLIGTSNTAAYSAATGDSSNTVNFHLTYPYFYVKSISQGVEIAFINDQDSIQLVSDLVPGKGSSTPDKMNGFTPTFWHTDIKGLPKSIVKKDTLYTILTNGGDNHFYIYEVIGTSVKSLFKIHNPDNSNLLFIESDYAYWNVNTENDGISILRRNLNELDSPQPEMVMGNSEEWFRQINTFLANKSTSDGRNVYPKKIRIDKKKNIVVEFNTEPAASTYGLSASPSDYKEIGNPNNNHIFAKYDKFGNFLWMNSVGGNLQVFHEPHQFELDSNDDLIIAGAYSFAGHFDSLVIETDEAINFVCKLDGETGEVIWQKSLFTDDNPGGISFNGIALDDQNNIYLPLRYFGFNIKSEDGQLLSSLKSPETAHMKLDADGNTIWLKNTPSPWLDKYGKTHVFNFNPSNQTITSVENQMYYNGWMSCAFRGQNSFVQTLDLEGNIVDSLSVGGTNDLFSLTEATFTDDGKLFGMGYFRNELAFGPYKTITSPTENCFTVEGYSFQYDPELQKMACANSTVNDNVFYPIDLRKIKNHIYALGTDKDHMLEILKFTTQGDYIGVKYLNQWADLRSWQFDNSFDVTEDHIVILGQNFRRDTLLGIRPYVNFSNSASILKIKNEGWINDGNRFQPILLEIDNSFADFVIYPNPFTNEINLTFDQKHVDFNSYQIHTVEGKFLLEGNLNYLQYQTINLSGLVSGVYAITLLGENKTETRKIVKY